MKFPVTIHKRPCSVVAGLDPAYYQPQGLILHLTIEIAAANWVWQAAPLRKDCGFDIEYARSLFQDSEL